VALDPYVKKALAEGHPLKITSTAGARYFLRKVDTSLLLKMKREVGVLQEILLRIGIREEGWRQALADPARLTNQGEATILIDALRERDNQQDDPGQSTVIELARLLTDHNPAELAAARGGLGKLTTGANLPVLSQFGFASLVAADGRADQAWTVATRSVQGLHDLLGAMPLIRDPGLRAGLYPRIEPLLHALSASLASGRQNTMPISSRWRAAKY